MALRYLELPAPQYVPTYNQLDTNLLAQTDAAVQQQGALAQQYRRDELDMAAQSTIDTFSNLSEEDQAFARQRFEKTRRNLGEIAQKQGARSLMPFVDQEVSGLERDLRFHQKAAQTKREAQEALAENDETPTEIKQAVLNKEVGVEYDEQGNPIGMKGGYNQTDLNIAANWEDWTDDVQSFVTNMNATSEESGQFLTDPNQIAFYRKKLESLGYGQISSGVVSFLMSKPKYREQLQLLGKTEIGKIQKQYETINAELKAKGENTLEVPVSLDDQGRVIAKLEQYVTKPDGTRIKEGEDEFGNPIFKTEEVTKKFNSVAEYKAAELGSTYGQQGYFKLSYVDTRTPDTGGTEDSVLNRFYSGREGLPSDEQGYQEYMQKTYESAERLRNQYDSIKNRATSTVKELFPNEDSVTSVDKETGELTVQLNGTSYTLDQLRETDKLGEDQYRSLKDYETAIQSSQSKARMIEKEREEANKSILNGLSERYPELEEFISTMQIDDQGNLQITETTPERFEGTVNEIIEGGSTYTFLPEDNKAILDKIPRNSTILTTLKGTKATPGTSGISGFGKGEEVTSNRTVFVSKDKQGRLTFNEVNRAFKDDFEEVSQASIDRITEAGAYDTASLLLDPEQDLDESIIETIKNQMDFATESGEGNVVGMQGDQVVVEADEGFRFNPQEVFIDKDGTAAMKGVLHRNDGQDPKPVYWTGNAVQSMLENKLGSAYQAVVADRAINNILPRIYDEGEVTMTPRDLRTIQAHIGGKTFDSVKVKARKIKSGRGTVTDYYITIPGVNDNQPYVRHSKEGIVDLLQQKAVESFE